MLRAWAAAAAMLVSALALGAPALAEAPASAPARVAQALRGDGRTARALREEAEVTRLVAGVDLVGDGLHPLFRANRGERGPCPPHGVYSGSGANFSALGFCCDADLCSSCGGPTCADLGTKISYVPKGTRRQENHCCKGWLAKNHKCVMRALRHSPAFCQTCDRTHALPPARLLFQPPERTGREHASSVRTKADLLLLYAPCQPTGGYRSVARAVECHASSAQQRRCPCATRTSLRAP